jgi:hypothetical protein
MARLGLWHRVAKWFEPEVCEKHGEAFGPSGICFSCWIESERRYHERARERRIEEIAEGVRRGLAGVEIVRRGEHGD